MTDSVETNETIDAGKYKLCGISGFYAGIFLVTNWYEEGIRFSSGSGCMGNASSELSNGSAYDSSVYNTNDIIYNFKDCLIGGKHVLRRKILYSQHFI